MPDNHEPDRTIDAPARDLHASASSDRDETATAAPRPGPAAPTFGPPAAPDEVGTLGPYRVVEQLGAGGMGAVYLAVDTRLDRKLALKVMLPEFAADRAAKERFIREAKAAAKVSHDNVVIVHEADERDGVPYIAMQFLQGYPLDEYLKNKGTPPLAHVIRIGRETALGLAAAHALGLVHRDIKPANLWLEAPNGRVKVLDFGLAKPIGTDTELTKSGAVVGTPAYMSPEQARGQKVDHRTDLFSLGAVLYRLCTGKAPFAGPNVMAVMMALGMEDPMPVRELNPNVPDALAELVHQLLAKKPEQRPQTASEVAKRLHAILSGLHAPSPPAGAPSGSASDLSVSQPVLVHPLPHQPPVVVPMQVTAAQESVFANLADEAEATAAEPTSAPKPERKTGGKGLLFAAGGVVLLAAVAVAVVVSQMGKKSETQAPDVATTGGEKGKPEPKGPGVPAGPLPATYTNGIGMEFVKVPKGTGWLGGGGGKPGEQKVVIERDFYLGKYEVTQEEWEKVTGLTPSHFSRTGGGKDLVKDISDADLKRFPVEGVSWDDCQAFIERLNTREKESGWVYRLPTEEEWEYACRGGPGDKLDSEFDYYFAKPTNTLLPEQANFNNVLKRTCKVGSYEPNFLALHDTNGNVYEWCENAVAGADGASHRVYRGGRWDADSEICRAAFRHTHPPSHRSYNLGLRVARVPSAPAGKPPAGSDPDRKAAEWVLSLGGAVWVNSEDRSVTTAVDLPQDRFSLTGLSLWDRPGVTDAGLAYLKECKYLTRVHLRGAAVTDVGLTHLKGCKNLTDLGLWLLPVTDAGLAVFKDCKDLTRLTLYAVSVTNVGLAHFKECKKVKHLHLGAVHQVTEVGLAVFKDCKDLIGLALTECGAATDTALAVFKDCKNLTTLNLNLTNVTDAGLVHFKDVPTLTTLFLNGTKVMGPGLEHLKGCQALTGLELWQTPMTDAGLVHLKNLKSLQYLSCNGALVTNMGLAHLKELKNLTAFELSGSSFTDEGLARLKELKGLAWLKVRNTKVTAKGLEEFAKAVPGCRIEHDGGVIEPTKK